MEHKYNQLSIERYSTSLAKLLCDRYFTGNPTVNGQQIIGFAPVKQVNLFIIKELLQRWNQEMANLKSPYFDFENEEVKEALVQFMNVLSRKILIKRPDFESLLTKAIHDTFVWTLDPAQVFIEKFLPGQEGASADKLQNQLKYIQVNKELVKSFLQNLPAGTLPADNILNQFKTYLLRNKHDITYTIDELVSEFNPVLPLDKADLLPTPPAPQPEPIAEPSQTSQSFFDELETESEPEVKERPIDQAEVIAAPPKPFEPEAPAPVEVPPVVVTPPAPVTSPLAGPVPVEDVRPPGTQEANLNDKFRAEKPTLNDRFAKPATSSLAESQMSKKIESLKDSISINQRFGFINELFNGENIEYYHVIQKLDGYTDADSAKNFVTQDLANKYNWSKKEEHVNKLLRLIERKFA